MKIDAILELGKRGLMDVVTLPEREVPIYRDLVEELTATQLEERVYTEVGYGLLQTRTADSAVQGDTNAVINYASFRPKLYALKATLPEWVWKKPEFDAYNKFRSMGVRLKRAAMHTKDYLATKMYIDGFSAQLATDGSPIFGNHTRYNGTVISNATTNALSVDALIEALGTVSANVNHRGIPMGAARGGFNLICGPTLFPDAAIIVESAGLADRMDRADNVLFRKNIKDLVMNEWQNSKVISGTDNFWFMIPAEKSKNPINFLEFQGVDMDTQNIPQNLQVAAVVRFAQKELCFHDAMIYGSQAA